MRRTAIILILALAVHLCGCTHNDHVDDISLLPEEPTASEPLVTATDTQMPTMINGQTIVVDGSEWMIAQEEMRDVIVHETTQNDDGSYTASISFSAMKDDQGVAVDASIRYTTDTVEIANGVGEILLHTLSSFEPETISKVGDW